MENASEANAQNLAVSQAANKVPGRQETQAIQIQLRDAGFNPGDGIFGNKTRSVMARLKADCPTVNELAHVFDYPLAASKKQVVASQKLETNSAKLQSLSATGRGDAPSARSQEDIRILQLRLRDAGFDPGPFDGVMGPKTKGALQQYQVAQRGNNAKLPVISGISSQY
jgi:peptidoglycan hydrolase-like protein with peptidoglycan-binding domain